MHSTLTNQILQSAQPDPEQIQSDLWWEMLKPEYLLKYDWMRYILNLILRPLKGLGGTSTSTISALLWVLLGVIIIFIGWWAWRTWRPRKKISADTTEELLIDPSISPQEYYQQALALRETDPDEAVKHAFRCSVAILDRAEVITVTPGRTAGEVAILMRRNFPDLSETINASATAFNTAAYSLEPAPRINVNDVNTVLILADALRTRVESKATGANVAPVATPTPQWEVSL
ncbi:hypothetical protein HMPREF0044_0103 [Gleimia coleocanis DSM 15436]|uniref:DUF4129 domain-containing protein n=1 Tax=Gleimia coleocanis DSM 15436 TaxID=525245 RepID=C0VY63_9ACTO|nr:DUF4129 domain-containing protein [Gleimia coleocanis]EEH64366.1 hypothetical protein HMPREF0044_0103 [Gleimia coleocanis DSM 15436]